MRSNLEEVVHNIIIGACQDVVKSHGKLDKTLIGSVAKRATPVIIEHLNDVNWRKPVQHEFLIFTE